MKQPPGMLSRQLVRYLFTGGAAAVVDIGGFELLSLNGLPVVVAASCSFIAATVVNFRLSSGWVFQASGSAVRFPQFFLGATVGLVVNVCITALALTYTDLPRALAKAMAIGVTFLLNFWINARFVFRGNAEDG